MPWLILVPYSGVLFRGRSRISQKGVHVYTGEGVCLADFISFTKTKLFHFHRILKNGGGGVGEWGEGFA